MFSYLFADAGVQYGSQNPLMGFVPLIVIFGIFYILLILPQQKRAKEHEKMLNSLKKDDYVLTVGGIYGTIVGIKDNIVELKIAENVRIQVNRNSISSVLNRPPASSESNPAEKVVRE